MAGELVERHDEQIAARGTNRSAQCRETRDGRGDSVVFLVPGALPKPLKPVLPTPPKPCACANHERGG